MILRRRTIVLLWRTRKGHGWKEGGREYILCSARLPSAVERRVYSSYRVLCGGMKEDVLPGRGRLPRTDLSENRPVHSCSPHGFRTQTSLVPSDVWR
jgi:hypothetical protein